MEIQIGLQNEIEEENLGKWKNKKMRNHLAKEVPHHPLITRITWPIQEQAKVF